MRMYPMLILWFVWVAPLILPPILLMLLLLLLLGLDLDSSKPILQQGVNIQIT